MLLVCPSQMRNVPPVQRLFSKRLHQFTRLKNLIDLILVRLIKSIAGDRVLRWVLVLDEIHLVDVGRLLFDDQVREHTWCGFGSFVYLRRFVLARIIDELAQSWCAFSGASLCLRAISHDLILRRIDLGGIFIGVVSFLESGWFLLGSWLGLV